VPGVLKHPPTDSIPQFSPHNPIAILLILLLAPLPNLVPRGRKLRTAAHPNSIRHLLPRKQALKSLLILSARMHSLSVFARFRQRLDLVGAAEGPGAADVDVAFFLEVRQLEVAKHGEAVVVRVVVVPLVAVGVDEEDVVGEGRVVVDYVAARVSVVSMADMGRKIVWMGTYVR